MMIRILPPKAGPMAEALRGLGYTTGSALADLIDNSISAGAANVHLHFEWGASASRVCVLDDGLGMDESELVRAMRLGDRSPLVARATSDLGRFGLGLKTASFSQCRRLTVASRQDGVTTCFRWDLDVLAAREDGQWCLLEGAELSAAHLLEPLNASQSGTLVVWEVVDRIVTPGTTVEMFLETVSQVERHLAMVFHRCLEGTHPKVCLFINDRRVKPWDPFLRHHPATWTSPLERIRSNVGTVEVQCFVLPHRDRLAPLEYESGAGPDGWTAQQGFYVYRNKRLLVAGSWLGLGAGRQWTKEESHRLARIQLDITNAADAEWNIDIRKSTARPPVQLRRQLASLAENTRKRARTVFAHRGRVLPKNNDEVVRAWQPRQGIDGMRYKIDREHPAVRAVLEAMPEQRGQVDAMLRILEETIPVQRIWLDTAEAKETPRTGFCGTEASQVEAVLRVMFQNMLAHRGMAPEVARQLLLRTEPFDDYPELVRALPDSLGGELIS